MSYPLATPVRLSLEGFARQAGLHPQLIRRFVALGLLEPARDGAGTWWFAPAQLQTVARIRRLRSGLAVNYAALGLVMDLLDRIELLEKTLRSTGARPPRSPDHPPPPIARCVS